MSRCLRTRKSERPLNGRAADPAVTPHLTRAEIDRRLAPEGYVGAARALVERVLRQSSS